MAYTFGSAAANVSAGNTITLSPATGALIVVFSANSGSKTIVFSDNSSSTWVTSSLSNFAGSFLNYTMGYCLSAAAGVTTITATYSGGTPGTCNLAAAAYTGMSSPSFVAVANPNEQTSPGVGANLVTANALACGSTPALLVVFSCDTSAANTGLSAGTGFTVRLNGAQPFDAVYLEDPNAEVTGSQTGTYTVGSHGTDNYATIAAAFADNASGGGTATIAWVT